MKFTISKVAQILDLSTVTLKRWYKWYENPDFKKPIELKLPEYTRGSRNTMMFDQKDIAVLQQFKEDLKDKYWGVMAEYNAYYQWGQYGTKRLKKLEKEREEKEENE